MNNVRIVSLVNQKGGSAKTTTAVSLAVCLAEQKKRVLLIDLDPQAHASKWLGLKEGGQLLDVIFDDNAHLADIVHQTKYGVDVVPSARKLMALERQLSSELGSDQLLKRHLKNFSQNWDVILIDCPASIGLVTLNALIASNEVLIPVESRSMALDGLAEFLQTMKTVQTRMNPELALTGILPCRVDLRIKHSPEVAEDIRRHFKRDTFKAHIRENVALSESYLHEPIIFYDSKSRGAQDYRAATSEFIKRRPTNE